MSLSRREFVKMASISALSLSLGGALTACAGPSASEPSGAVGLDGEGRSQVIIAMNTGSEPEAGFNPIISWGSGEHVHEPLIQSTLITTTTELGFANDLARAYESSADGMSWTFHIRDDAFFTNGAQLTAHDVAFTINQIIESDQAQADLSMVRQARAIDDFTVILDMKQPDNALLYTLAVVGIVPEASYGPDYGDHPIGSGRYKLVQWDKGQQVILEANPDYYGPAPLIERVIVLFMSEDAALAAAQSGQVDVAFTTSTLAAQVPEGYELLVVDTVDSRGISLPTVPAGSPSREEDGLSYPVGNEVSCDLAIRRAINYGLDRARMIEQVLSGYGRVAYGVADGMPWSSPDMRVSTDVSQALQLLEDAGWVEGGDGVREKDGLRASLTLYYASNDSVRQALAADFAVQMAELGIEVNIAGASWDEIYPHQYSDLVLWGWGSNSPVELFELTYSTGWGNYASYDNAEIDALLEQAIAAPTIEQSYPYYQKAQWNPETGIGVAPQGAASWVWLANVDHLYFQREGLIIAEQKLHPHGHGWSLVNNIDQWSWA